MRELVVDPLSDADVGQQHELLDQAVGLPHLLLLDVDRFGALGALHVDLDLRGGEVQGSGGHPLRFQFDGQGVQQAD